MQQKSISYVTFEDGTSCIIASLPQREDTQIIYVDPIMGTLNFLGIDGYDIFDSKDSALSFLLKTKKLKSANDAHSILGYLISDNCCYLLLVESARPLFPMFGKHMIYAVEKVTTIEIPTLLSSCDAQKVQIENFQKYPYSYSHFFCQTYDLSLAFGKSNVVRTPVNAKLMIPFSRFAVPNICISLFQGTINYTSFPKYNTGVLFMASRTIPSFVPQQGKHAVKENVTSNDYLIDVFLIKDSGNGFEVLNHCIQVGDFPFNWIYNQNKYTALQNDACETLKSFIQYQKNKFKIDNVYFANFMSNKQNPESVLTDTLEFAVTNTPGLTGCEQDSFEWVQPDQDPGELDNCIQLFWPQIKVKINKFGITRSVSEQPDVFNIQSHQKGIIRFVFGNSFERELLGIFFFFLKLFEKMCNMLKLGFPNPLVTTSDIQSFDNGFTQFTANFLTEFSQTLLNLGSIPTGGLISILSKNYMKQTFVNFSHEPIDYNSVLLTLSTLINMPRVYTFSATLSISSFVFSNCDNAILNPNNKKCYELHKCQDPLVICLSEPCYIREVLIRNCNAASVSIYGGYRLNRTFKIISNFLIPYIPKDGHEPYIRIPLNSTNPIYEYELRPHDYEKIRFLILKFKPYQKERIKIGNVLAYGASKVMIGNTRAIFNEVKFNLDVPQTVTYEGNPTFENYFRWEKKRLEQNESYSSFQKFLIKKCINIDSYNLNKICFPPKIIKEPKKAICEKCQIRDQCIECSMCTRKFCKRCLDPRAAMRICDFCKVKRDGLIANISTLKGIQLALISTLYPFIWEHNEQTLKNKKIFNANKKPLNFKDINRPFIATFAYEPPPSSKLMKTLDPKSSPGSNILRIYPESLFSENINWSFESSTVQLNIILVSECQIDGLLIGCNSEIKVCIDGAEPNCLVFTPPGCLQRLNYKGRMAKLIITGKDILIRHIQFFGNPIINEHKVSEELEQSNRPRRLTKMELVAVSFNEKLNCHEIKFAHSGDVCGLKFKKFSFLPKEIMVEFLNEKNMGSLKHFYVGSVCSPNDRMCLVVFHQPISANAIRIYYPNISAQKLQLYSKTFPEVYIPQKGPKLIKKNPTTA